MNKHAFYIASIVLLIVALGFHVTGRGRASEGQKIKAENIQSAAESHEPLTLDPEVAQLSNSARFLNRVGMGFMLCGLLTLVVAKVRREAGWYAVPILALVFDFMVQMML